MWESRQLLAVYNKRSINELKRDCLYIKGIVAEGIVIKEIVIKGIVTKGIIVKGIVIRETYCERELTQDNLVWCTWLALGSLPPSEVILSLQNFVACRDVARMLGLVKLSQSSTRSFDGTSGEAPPPVVPSGRSLPFGGFFRTAQGAEFGSFPTLAYLETIFRFGVL